MVFSSVTFIFYFLPLVIALYALAKGAYKNGVLLIASLFFYFYGEGMMTFVLLFVMVFSFAYAKLLEKRKTKLYLTVGLIICFAPLIYYKYSSFILENFGIIYRIALPLGISFFSFQASSYLIDVYRGDVGASHSLLNYGTYLTFFGQLVAGPIVRYETIAKEVKKERPYNEDDVYLGLRRFVIGLGKKCILANTLGACASAISVYDEGMILWLISILEILQLYFDFSAYSDMAIGLGLFFGFHFLENFDYPLCAVSIRNFWQRWHMSLGTWFKDYVYFPLGGSRCTPLVNIRNLLVVWLLTGLWHGAAWNFVFWGIYFGAVIILERYTPLKKIVEVKYLNHLYTIFVILVGFVFFNHGDDPLGFIVKMFDFSDFLSPVALYYLKSYGVLIILAALAATPFPKMIYRRYSHYAAFRFFEPIGVFALFIVALAYLVGSGFNPFLYFRF